MTHRMLRTTALAGLALVAGAAPAAAHVPGAEVGFAAGLTHPLGGLDHILAMIAVGLWAAQLGGRALWMLPAAFLGAMALGGGAGMVITGTAPLELAVVGSVAVLGAAVALGPRVSALAAAAMVAAFGTVHGHAHGAEMAAGADGAVFAAGFLLATAALHGAGLAAALGLSRVNLAPLTRAAGTGIALAGVVLLAA